MFKWIKRFTLLLILSFVFVVAIVFASENNTPISLQLFGFQLAESSIGFLMCAALLLGAFVGVFINFIVWFFRSCTLISKDKKIKSLEKELAALRISGVKKQ